MTRVTVMPMKQYIDRIISTAPELTKLQSINPWIPKYRYNNRR